MSGQLTCSKSIPLLQFKPVILPHYKHHSKHFKINNELGNEGEKMLNFPIAQVVHLKIWIMDEILARRIRKYFYQFYEVKI